MKRYITAIGLIAAITTHAQDRSAYFNANLGGGVHSLKYDLQNGNVKGGIGGTFNLGYSYFFNPSWGLTSGLGFYSAQAKGTLNYVSEMTAVDQDGDGYVFRTYFNDWEEKQKSVLLNIPLGIQHQRWFNGKNGVLASAGLMVSIPISSSYKVTSGSLITAGYYEQWNVELRDLPQHGFSTITSRPSGSITLKPAYSAFADLGWIHKITEQYDLYVGGYFSYGFNNLISADKDNVYQSDGIYSSMLASSSTEKVKLFTVGLKVGVRLHVGHRKKTSEIVVPVAVDTISYAPEFTVQPIVNIEPMPVEIDKEAKVKPEPVVSIADTVVKSQEIAKQIDLKFPLNSDVPLNDEFDNPFKELAKTLIANPTLKVRIKGHTCNIASREYNLTVGLARAEVGKAKLMEMGVPESQIILESKAFDEPLVPNTGEENRAKNRRIEMIIEQH